ncbi:helix-turn-helix transcriptional regulator [bacterium]|nr:helix-turn-helix transcriptional regulator [bacterium]
MNKSARFLKTFRRAERMTIKELSDKLNINYRFLSNIENSRSLASIRLLIKLSSLYYGFDLPTALSLLASDKSLLGAKSVVRRSRKREGELSAPRAAHLNGHLAMTPFGLLRYASTPEEIVRLSGSNCDFLLRNPRKDRIKATGLVVKDQRPVDGQQALVVNPTGVDIVAYDANFHGAYPSYVVSDTLQLDDYYLESGEEE